MRPFIVYLLRCSDSSYYCGQTDDIASRLQHHYAGEIGYTSTRKPVELVWQGEFETREAAIAFEQQIKGWSRAKKEALIRGDWDQIKELASSKPSSVRPELVEGLRTVPVERLTGLRQAQPERDGVLANRSNPSPVHPEPFDELRTGSVEGLSGLRPAQPERSGVMADQSSLSPVRPEPVEGLTGLRQAQPERNGELVELGGLTEDPSTEPVLSSSKGSGRTVLGTQVLDSERPNIQRRAIAKAITLLESTRADHRAQADELLTSLLPHTGNSFRIGISGVPGVGKSTFIEVLGLYLIEQGHRVAVLTIDPSSTVSGGSILGDKTRMEKLSVHERAYIRPSPSSGTLGGVAEKTREAMLVCEAAGYDIVIVETVGVGQSETAVAGMTDMFVLMQLPNAGDDLQAIKKGVMELADLVVINKADIDALAAQRAQLQITAAMQLLGMFGDYDEKNWHPKAIQLSALNGQGVDAFWAAVMDFKTRQTANGKLANRRQQQSLAWMWERIDTGLKQAFKNNPAVREQLQRFTVAVQSGQLAASTAARNLLAVASETFTVRAEPVEAHANTIPSPSTGSGRTEP